MGIKNRSAGERRRATVQSDGGDETIFTIEVTPLQYSLGAVAEEDLANIIRESTQNR